jgi:hypothetical protein
VTAALLLAACATPSSSDRAPTAGAAAPAVTISSWDRLPVLDALDTALLYHQHSDAPLPTEALAFALPGVCGVVEEDARKEAVDGSWARLVKARRAVAERRRWLITLQQSLGGYDLVRGGFPTGLTREAGPRFGGAQYCFQGDMNYAVGLANWKDFGLFPMPGDRAREFVRSNSLRSVIEDLEVEAAGAEAAPLPVLLVRILRLRVRDAQTGALLIDTGAPAP